MTAAPEDLQRLQQLMGHALQIPLVLDDEHELQAQNNLLSDDLVSVIHDSKQLPARERLQAYNEQYWYRILGSLEEDLPALKHVMGAHAFHDFCTAFITHFPSQSHTLRDLPLRLPVFLDAQTEWNSQLHREIIQHALIHIDVFDCAEEAALDPSTLDPAARCRITTNTTQTPSQLSALS